MKNYFDLPWDEWFPINSLNNEQKWDNLTSKSGIYLISRQEPVQRIGGVDIRGIVYIGKSLNLVKRLDGFWNANHPASGILWENLSMAKIFIGQQVNDQKDVAMALSQFRIRAAFPIKRNQLVEAERSVIMAYLLRFGEPPPLNFSIPGGRWKIHSDQGIAWGKKAISS